MNLDWKKMNDLIPAIVQHYATGEVLMLGYQNPESWAATLATRRVTFYSRSKQRLWEKGEQSGHTLTLKDWALDCDGDALLLQVQPAGPVCHTGSESCFGEQTVGNLAFLSRLESVIDSRAKDDPETSYTARLLRKGTAKIAQKVGEEAVEVVIEAMQGNRERLIEESADLLYHWLVLLRDQGVELDEVVACLKQRHAGN
ncbi:MAG: bifunctional phosphoribosyl-AMP cyclohydrolase/phosphoribosyl-ATP diphosphatase HisIE [Salibacteraceae bacterium]